ncbi:MAG: hypothetical protein AB7P07_00670 [Hyphomonadaceae bacterium]
MPFDESHAAGIELIVVTDDDAHARRLIEALRTGRHLYTITTIAARDALHPSFDAAIEAARGKRPVIAFLDCASLGEEAEVLAARVLGLQATMAIECVATRPPSDLRRRGNLRALGASVYEEPAPAAEIIPLH